MKNLFLALLLIPFLHGFPPTCSNANAGTDPANTFTLGDGQSTVDKKFKAATGAANKPFIQYNVTGSKWEVSNDGVAVNDIGSSGAAFDSGSEITNLGCDATVAANALTISLKGKDGNNPSGSNIVKLGFRSATLTSGTYSQVSVSSSTSMTVSSGSTLGTESGVQSYLYVYAINNAGTVELAVSKTKFVDEGTVISTTAEGGAGAADSQSILYSTTARTNVPARLVCRLSSTQATAGTWATAIAEKSVIPFENTAILYAWSGFHDEDCSWSRTNSAFGDPAADASCTFTERLNSNFGPVSSVSGLLPGVTFTAPATGVIEICTHGNMAVVGANTMYARLWDGTSALDATSLYLAAGAHSVQMGLCGQKKVTVGDSVTAQWQWGTTGAVNADLAVPAAGAGLGVSWTMKYIGRF